MKKFEIFSKATLVANKVGFTLKKHSPEILVVSGVVGTVAAAVLACKATTKVGDILDEAKENIAVVHETLDDPEIPEEKYSKEDANKDLAIFYAQTGVKLVKLYAPAVILGTLSIGCILTSNNILRKRNVALAAAYATIDKSFKEYRHRVVDKFGETVDREMRYGAKVVEVNETVTDENGKKKTTKKNIEVAGAEDLSGYARFFDVGNPNWEKNGEYNLMFLRAQQQYANDLLRAKGHVFLNEVYAMLGIKQSAAGQMVGWVYNLDDPAHDGDNYIDFGIRDMFKPLGAGGNAIDDYERTYLLDFNVDGNIMDKVKWSDDDTLC